MTRDDLVAAAVRAYKGNQSLDPASPGLTWLRTPLERVVDVLVPLIREEALRDLHLTAGGKQ